MGIRHHGAGSALRIQSALAALSPDCICIELPYESTTLFPYFKKYTLKPPFAFLFYHPLHPNQSMYLPFADFSPEYQAILFSTKNKIPLYPIDLPAGEFIVSSNFNTDMERDLSKEQRKITADPIGYLAKTDGYADSERWWEIHFESWINELDLFTHILHLMGALRKNSQGLDDAETLLREQSMRNNIRNCIQKGYKRIAVICGAWHAPVLTKEFLLHSQGEPIQKLKSKDIKACIIPWSYKMLSLNAGYGAGLVSPMWHESLYFHKTEASSYFLSHCAQLLRKEGYEVSTSAIIDAEQLAYQLAVIRHLPMPGLEEVLESAQCIFSAGKSDRIDWIKEIALIGEKNGEVPLDEQTLPLVFDFYLQLKSTRLKRFWGEEEEKKLELDLRKENQRIQSKFLHLCALSNLKWARPKELEFNSLGNFHEHWSFHWEPHLELSLVQLALKGNSLRLATIQLLVEKLSREDGQIEIAQLLEHALKADLHEVIDKVMEAIERSFLHQQDIAQWVFMLRPLQSSIQYGNLHTIDTASMQRSLDRLIPKIVLSFPDSCRFIDEDRSRKLLSCLLIMDTFFSVHTDHPEMELWKHNLYQMAFSIDTHVLIKGKIWNLLLENEKLTIEDLQYEMESQWFTNDPKLHPALWLEGFLHQGNTFYLLHQQILDVLDQWISSLDEESFKKNLSLLRRIFDLVPESEKMGILTSLKNRNPDVKNHSSKQWWLNRKIKNEIDLYLDNVLNVDKN